MQAFKGRFKLKPAATTVGAVILVLVIYVGFLIIYRMLDHHSGPPSADLDLSRDSETVVVIDLQDLRTVNNRLDAEVVVLPAKTTLDAFGLLKADMSVRLVSSLDYGERHFPRGTVPVAMDETLVATGDAQSWPFDEYSTGNLRAEVMVGNGEGRRPVPARIEVIGSLGGWRASTETSPAPAGTGDQTTVTLVRARGTLAFDAGICLVLITLPTMALIVAIETVKGRKKFHPPLTTWFGTMLFAIVPLRNILPGAPPPGAWIDQALVLWVLIALVVAMVLYVEAWWKQSE
ncbi:DUF4436 domain-containing protein [Mycobacteroides salmoniphilum]|uniref:DUF4436 domain-containing protein n=1 Tax=Mycobacteroides salmoniphilum TaxID=404941 RepID=UPI00356AF561